MTDYDQFARFYDAIMGVPRERIGAVRELIEKFHPAARTVLELGCGTGSVLSGLGDKYVMSGLDQSEKMLAVARAKVPSADFFQGDMADFRLDRQFDVIICVFDSINHLLRFEQWEALFKCAFAHLKAGGILIFDMNTLARLKAVTTLPFEEQFEGGSWSVKVNEIQGIFEWNLTFLEDLGNGQIKKYFEKISEVAFEAEQVEQALKSHFEIRAKQDANGQLITPSTARIYFVAKKISDPNI